MNGVKSQLTTDIEPHTRLLWEGIRQALLMMVDAIERYLGINPRTAELRREKR